MAGETKNNMYCQNNFFCFPLRFAAQRRGCLEAFHCRSHSRMCNSILCKIFSISILFCFYLLSTGFALEHEGQKNAHWYVAFKKNWIALPRRSLLRVYGQSLMTDYIARQNKPLLYLMHLDFKVTFFSLKSSS